MNGSSNITVQAGSFTSAPVTIIINPTTGVLGNIVFTSNGTFAQNYIDAVYAVTGTSPGGYTVNPTCSFYMNAGSQTAGAKRDCGIILAPTPTTMASSWLCYGTYTAPSTVSPNGWVSVPLSGCGVLPPSTGYLVATITNDTAAPPKGSWNCGTTGGACTGSAPTVGNGTFAQRQMSATYGIYSGLGTSTTAGGPYQPSQYVTLNSSIPTLVGGYLANAGPTTTLAVGGSVPFFAFCQYSDSSVTNCFPGTDIYGNTVTAFVSSNSAVLTVNNIGAANPGLATGISPGFASVIATISGGPAVTSPWVMTVSGTPLPFPPISPSALLPSH
jgi:hypothetical protein